MSKTKSGQPWQAWIDRGAACPSEYPFGQRFAACGQVWTCIDRGGKVTGNHFDLLASEVPCDFSSPRNRIIQILNVTSIQENP